MKRRGSHDHMSHSVWPCGHPFGQHLAGAAGLGDAEGEDAGLEGVRHAGHRANQRIAVGRVGDRPVDHLGQSGLAQHRHAANGVVEIVLQPLQIVGEELEGEIVRHRIVVADPMRAAIALVGAEVHAVLFLPQVVGGVDVAQQRQLPAMLFRPCRKLGDLLEQYVLMAHHHHRHVAAEHRADLASAIAGGVDHIFAADFALRRRHDPFAALAADGGDRAEPHDRRAEVAGALGKRLRQLRRIDIAVVRIVERTFEVVCLDERVARPDLVGADHVDVHALIAAHSLDALELAHALLRVGKAERAGDVVIHGIVDGFRQPAIELGRVALHVHQRPGRREGRHVAGCVPGRAGGQLVLFEQHAVGPAGLRQMIERGDADRAAADDDHAGRGW